MNFKKVHSKSWKPVNCEAKYVNCKENIKNWVLINKMKFFLET